MSRALDNCGPGNILRELAKKTDQSKVDALETEKAHLIAQVAAMTLELAQKTEEIRCYHAEQAVVINRVREFIGYPGEIVNKAHLYDKLMETMEPSSAKQILQILVKYSRMMKDLLKEIQELLPPHGTPRRMTDSGLPGSPTGGVYEVVGEVELVSTAQATPGPSQAAGTSRPHESSRAPDREKIPELERVRSPPIRRKSTERSARSGRVQSPMPEHVQS